ncbi:hypothetical protein H4R26_000092 [Coemansia thaxteri]|uniref:SH3 domain-containing protein n=1 Tax=Coemansia thaxteri TaxID=2663907 RepID=A0A9W8EMG4_9FUNG|nr:hypothetical protein H4R26_000092 [Coemansia thaxteri]
MLLALAFAILPHISIASSTCLSLKHSQGCPGFAQEFVSTNTTTRFSWFPKDDITAFDKALNDYVSGLASLEEFQAVFRCPGLDSLGGFNTDHGSSVVRYHRSIICADILFNEDNVSDCYDGSKPSAHRRRNNGNGDPEAQLAEVVATSNLGVRQSAPTPLCRSTCTTWIDSLRTIVSNGTLCQANKGINRDASLDSLHTKCDIAAFSGAAGRCVDGSDNEPKTCGFQRVEDWCKYCKHATKYADTCAAVGVLVSDNTGSDDGDSDDAKDTRVPGIPSPTNDHRSNGGLTDELEKQTRQERVFRVVAIVLSVVVGVCLIALMVIIGLSRSVAGQGTERMGRGAYSGENGGDGSAVFYLGKEGSRQGEKAADFVDCFITTVGKPRQVVRHFFARRDDEISLQQGDIVTLQMAFDDGWVVGKNLTTGAEGTFPLMCVMENLPASLPAQWSVLPESKNASAENIRRPSRAIARQSPHSSMLGSMSLPAGLEIPTLLSIGRNDMAGADMLRTSEQAYRASTIVPAGNISRMSRMSTAPGPIVSTTHMPLSPHQNSTRTTPANRYGYSTGELIEAQRTTRARAILNRLLNAFAQISGNSNPSSSFSGHSETSAGFFKRLVTSPFGARSKPPSGESPKNKQGGRPHSFTVNHVVHVGLSNPNFPRTDDMNSSVPTLPSNGPSLNGYPVISVRSSLGRDETSRLGNGELEAASSGFPRQPLFGYGEFAPSNNSRQLATATGSLDTYQTAEQSTYGNTGVLPSPVTAAVAATQPR